MAKGPEKNIKKMAKSLEKRKEKKKKFMKKMDALMKTWQTGILAQRFESREKFHP